MSLNMEHENGLIRHKSTFSVSETIDRLENQLKAAGLKIFARIDHAAAAKQAGLEMPPTVVLLFGNPRGGTPMMLAAPTLAIDLPFKALISEDASGQVWLTYNSPEYLIRRHQAPEVFAGNLNHIAKLLLEAISDETR